MKIETIKEYHQNGQIAYLRHFRILNEEEYSFFKNKGNNILERSDKTIVMDVLENQKYFENGQRAWGIVRDKDGQLLEIQSSHRADGTNIQY